jgi:uncharacterized membrane protein HdeD (DUF308 family)
MPTITQTMNMDTVAAPLGRRWGWLLTLGIVEIIAGGIAIAAPVIASLHCSLRRFQRSDVVGSATLELTLAPRSH